MSNHINDIETQLDRWFSAVKTGDAAVVSALYAPDAILLSTLKGEVMKGREKISSYFAEAFLPRRPLGVVLEPHTRLVSGVGINSGLYRFELDGKGAERVVVVARYTFVYQWLNDDWIIVEHHSSLSPTG